MAGFQVIIVTRSVQVGGHDGQKFCPVLAVVTPALLDSRNLGQSVGTVGGLQRAGQQIFFLHGLGGMFGIDAGGAEEQQSGDVMLVGCMDDIGLDHQIFVDELRRIGVVGKDAPDLGGCEKYVIRFFLSEKFVDRLLAGQVQFTVRSDDNVFISLAPQRFAQGRAHKAAVPGYIHFALLIHEVHQPATVNIVLLRKVPKMRENCVSATPPPLC